MTPICTGWPTGRPGSTLASQNRPVGLWRTSAFLAAWNSALAHRVSPWAALFGTRLPIPTVLCLTPPCITTANCLRKTAFLWMREHGSTAGSLVSPGINKNINTMRGRTGYDKKNSLYKAIGLRYHECRCEAVPGAVQGRRYSGGCCQHAARAQTFGIL